MERRHENIYSALANLNTQRCGYCIILNSGARFIFILYSLFFFFFYPFYPTFPLLPEANCRILSEVHWVESATDIFSVHLRESPGIGAAPRKETGPPASAICVVA